MGAGALHRADNKHKHPKCAYVRLWMNPEEHRKSSGGPVYDWFNSVAYLPKGVDVGQLGAAQAGFAQDSTPLPTPIAYHRATR